MADLGAIGRLLPKNKPMYVMRSSQAAGPLTVNISGTVLDQSANPARRLVRAYIRNGGRYVGETYSDPTTGAYTIVGVDNVEHNLIAFDDDGSPTENDLILRTTPGV
jgi:hypothetical protein